MFPTRMLPRNRRPNLKQLAPQQNIKQRTRNTSIYQAISPVCTGHGLVELCFIAATELPGRKPLKLVYNAARATTELKKMGCGFVSRSLIPFRKQGAIFVWIGGSLSCPRSCSRGFASWGHNSSRGRCCGNACLGNRSGSNRRRDC